MSKDRTETVAGGISPSSAPEDNSVPLVPRKRRLRAALFLVTLAALIAAGVALTRDWRETQRQEAYLPQLEAQARRDPYDGRLLALLAGRLMEAGEYPAAADTLRRAAAAGEQGEAVWQALAAATAAAGDPARAIGDLRIGIKTLPQAPALQTALTQCETLGPSPAPAAVAQAISPRGAQPLLDIYGRGSGLNGLADWWGRHHAEDSGFATRLRGAEARPNDAQAQRLWGEALRQNRRLPEAAAVLQHAVTLAPKFARRPPGARGHAGAGRPAVQGRPGVPRLPEAAARLAAGPARLGPKRPGSGPGRLRQQRLHAGVPGRAGCGRRLDRPGPRGAQDRQRVRAGRRGLRESRPPGSGPHGLLRRLRARALSEQPVGRGGGGTAPTPGRRPGGCLRALRTRAGAARQPPDPPRQAEAEAQTREVLRLQPHNPSADTQLGEMLLDRGQTREAIGVLTDARVGDPSNRNALLLLARAYRQGGQPVLAAKTAQQAAVLLRDQERIQVLEAQESRDTLNVPLHQELAVLDARTGKPERARREQEMARLLQADPQGAARALKSFHAETHGILPTH